MIEVQEFRAEVRAWLDENLVGEFAALKGLGGPGREDEAFAERLAWNKHLAAAGRRAGAPVELKLYPDVGHIDIVAAFSDLLHKRAPTRDDVVGWIDSH